MATIVNARDLFLRSASTRMVDITSTLDSTSTLIKTDPTNITTPSSFTITTTLGTGTVNFPTNCTRSWYYRPNDTTTWTPISTSTSSNQIIVSNTTFLTHVGLASAVEYKVVLSYAGFRDSVSTILISYQKEVANTVMLQLSSYVGTVSANSAGTVTGSYTTATARVYNGNTLLTSGVTFNVEGGPSSTKNGLTVSIDSAGTITPSGASWTTDGETFNINAIYDSITYIAKYSVVKSKAGSTGNSTVVATVYLQTGTAPATPSGGSYNFSNGTLTPPSGGWQVVQPATTTVPTYACDYTFTGSPSSTVSAGTWGAPYIEAVNGTNGEYRDIIQLYLQSGSMPTAPTSLTYTFSNNSISGVSGGTAGWSLTQPASSTTPTYIIRTLAATTTPSVGLSLPMAGNSWSTPVVVAQNGTNGATGPQGPSGSNGAQGTRGNLTVNLGGGWSDSSANSLIASAASSQGATPTSPINGDIAYYTGGAKVYNYGWSAVTSFIDGSLVVTGTLGADKITANTTISSGVSLNTGGYVRAYGSYTTTAPGFGSQSFVAVLESSSAGYGAYIAGSNGGLFGYAINGGVGVRGYMNSSYSGGIGVVGNGTAYGLFGSAYAGYNGVGAYLSGTSGIDLMLASATVNTASSNAYYSATKPGSSSVYNVWYPVIINGTTYYIPVWQA